MGSVLTVVFGRPYNKTVGTEETRIGGHQRDRGGYVSQAVVDATEIHSTPARHVATQRVYIRLELNGRIVKAKGPLYTLLGRQGLHNRGDEDRYIPSIVYPAPQDLSHRRRRRH